MLSFVILYSLYNIVSVFHVCDNRGESRFQYSDKPLDQIICLFCVCDNMRESEFQYPPTLPEQIDYVFCAMST